MRLPEFILVGMEKILIEWEAFAVTLYPANTQMTKAGLRDHAKEILRAIAADLCTEQTGTQQSLKSKGLIALPVTASETAAQTHAVLRAQSGMDINQLASEYRALRASVLRLWGENHPLDGESLRDIIRFNEAIDQSLAESISFFHDQVEQSRNLLLGMLGHDMRNPLNAIVLTAQQLAWLNAGEEVSEAATSLTHSGVAMKSLLDDLVDFSRRKLGLGIGINIAPVDLGELCANEVRLHRAAHPGSVVHLHTEGDLHGSWDGPRIQQVLRNLLSNATYYGTAGEPIKIGLQGLSHEVSLEVVNSGPTIDEERARYIFEPLQRGDTATLPANSDGLGLGLYIVREITHAHGGKVEMHSEGSETRFCVRLPRTLVA